MVAEKKVMDIMDMSIRVLVDISIAVEEAAAAAVVMPDFSS